MMDSALWLRFIHNLIIKLSPPVTAVTKAEKNANPISPLSNPVSSNSNYQPNSLQFSSIPYFKIKTIEGI